VGFASPAWSAPDWLDGGRAGGDPVPSRWILPFVLVAVIASDRVFLVVETGGHGVFPLLALIAPIAAIGAVLRYGIARSLGFIAHPAFIFGVLPYLILTVVLPILGVMFHGYPERTLLSVSETTTALSFLVLGAVAASNDDRGWLRWLLPAIAVEFAYALGQTINWARGPGWELFTPFAGWDRSLATLADQISSEGRATGLFTNPNELGLWASVAAVLAWTLLPGRQRAVGVTLAALTLLLSQSRGPTVGLVAAVVAGAALGIARGRLVSMTAFRAVATLTVAAAVVVVVTSFQLLDVPLDRFGFLIQVVAVGPQADANLAGRISLWSGVLNLNLAFPLGTWGSPELILGTAVDSAWFHAFAQGSAIYVVAVALLFGAAMAVRNATYGDALRLTVVVLAVVGLTQTTLGSPVTPLFWAVLGLYLGASVAKRGTNREAEIAWPTGTPRPVDAIGSAPGVAHITGTRDTAVRPRCTGSNPLPRHRGDRSP
jgi:hypothetical protein